MPRFRDPDEITRSFRINRDLWQRAIDRATERRESLSEAIRQFLIRYAKGEE